jgi:hypothetical protein
MMMRVGRGVSSLRIDSARPAIRVTGQEMGIREREGRENISKREWKIHNKKEKKRIKTECCAVQERRASGRPLVSIKATRLFPAPAESLLSLRLILASIDGATCQSVSSL